MGRTAADLVQAVEEARVERAVSTGALQEFAAYVGGTGRGGIVDRAVAITLTSRLVRIDALAELLEELRQLFSRGGLNNQELAALLADIDRLSEAFRNILAALSRPPEVGA